MVPKGLAPAVEPAQAMPLNAECGIRSTAAALAAKEKR